MANTHSSILAWKIPWTEESGRLQSMGSQRVRHNWATNACAHTHTHTHTHSKTRFFRNLYVSSGLAGELSGSSFLPEVHRRIPPSDGSLCLRSGPESIYLIKTAQAPVLSTKLSILHPWKPATGYWNSFQGSPSLTQPSALLPHPSLFLSPSL